MSSQGNYQSKDEFEMHYGLLRSRDSAQELYLLVLCELHRAVVEGNVDTFKNLCQTLGYFWEVEDSTILKDFCDHPNNPVKGTNFVILACKHSQTKIVQYLFGGETQILELLAKDPSRVEITPSDQDDMCHDAFYYAIRSGNIDLLDSLISKWPHDHFKSHPAELDKILSKAFEDLKIRNVPLSEKMEIFVESKLIDVRFFSNDSLPYKIVTNDNMQVKDRISLVLEKIHELMLENSNTKTVYDKLLFTVKFIAQNIHILKRQLKSTYDRLPWEEIEFCLICFVASHIKSDRINLAFNTRCTKLRTLKHLENFANRLQIEKETIECKVTNVSSLKRVTVVAEIIQKNPEFEKLYEDYQQMRDIHSLEKINYYIKLACSVDPYNREGQLVIMRAIQSIGEYMKNTMESPKLSATTSEFLLLSLPNNTRKILIYLRNSLSHAYSLSKRIEIEEKADNTFHVGLQNDMKRINNVIVEILYNHRIKVIKTLLNELILSESLDHVKELIETLREVKFYETTVEECEIFGYEKLEKLIEKLENTLSGQTFYGSQLLTKELRSIMSCGSVRSRNMNTNYDFALKLLSQLTSGAFELTHTRISNLKEIAKNIKKHFASNVESLNLQGVAEITMKFLKSAESKILNSQIDEIQRLSWKILLCIEFELNDIKFIRSLREKLIEKNTRFSKFSLNTEEKYRKVLALKITELKGILKSNSLCNTTIESVQSYKKNTKMQAATEMLVLDILSILGILNGSLENNLLFLDDDTPLLIGKCLRNHLAHGNTLLEVVGCNPGTAIVVNARKLMSENILTDAKKVGKWITDNPVIVRNKCNKSLLDIYYQEKLFHALEEGNLNDVKKCLKNGADINGRCFDGSSTVHFAVKGSSLDVVKFVLDHNLDVNAKNKKGEGPIHVAAELGRRNNVEFLVKEKGAHVDATDGTFRTPLHIASKNGQIDTVKILLEMNADIEAKDNMGFSPLHYGVLNNHIDIVNIFQSIEGNADVNEFVGGFTSLHLAADSGLLDMVKFLLKHGADVNATRDGNITPLHLAALSGKQKVVESLILNGADVSPKVFDGCTPLHYAIENGHLKTAYVLIKHGANVNAVDKAYKNSPLHYAAEDGYDELVDTLLVNNANPNMPSVHGITPLHFAAMRGHAEIVASLLSHGAKINFKSKSGLTALHFAVQSGCQNVVELLINGGAEININTGLSGTPLHIAAMKGFSSIIELLLKNNADVTAKTEKGISPLHVAAISNDEVIRLLIKNNAAVDDRNEIGMTPLHYATMHGNERGTIILLENNAEVNAEDKFGATPLLGAIMWQHRDEELVHLLLEHGAKFNTDTLLLFIEPLLAALESEKKILKLLVNIVNINLKIDNKTLLEWAVIYNHKVIAETLINNGACIGDRCLGLAVYRGHKDMVQILIKNGADLNSKCLDEHGISPLHIAAMLGNKDIVKVLLLGGSKVNAVSDLCTTPLNLAAEKGHEEVVELLVSSGSDVNHINREGTPLHTAAHYGHSRVVEILLRNGAKPNTKDLNNCTPLELAASRNHLKVVSLLLRFQKVDVNAKGDGDFTVLHIASQEGHLKVVEILVEKGYSIHAKINSGAKCIHLAAREGHKEVVEFFLSRGMKICEPGKGGQTVLHYAAMNTQTEVLNYLISQGADINARDDLGLTPLHLAAFLGNKSAVLLLLKNGAIYNAVNKLKQTPLTIRCDGSVINNILTTTEHLFESVKNNHVSKVKRCILAGASVHAKNSVGGTAIHLAASKGYYQIADILLQHQANPNVTNFKGFSPLHYAAKFSHLKLVKILLTHGAVFNHVSDNNKTPLHLAKVKEVVNLLSLIHESFDKVAAGDTQVICDLNNIKDMDTAKAVMRARTREGKTLVSSAIHHNFLKVEQLKGILQGDVSAQINFGLALSSQGNYIKALNVFQKVLTKRTEILGPDNPGTLDIQATIASTLFLQGKYQVALDMMEDVYHKRKELLGLNNKDTLRVRSLIALVLHTQGKNEEAISIFDEVYKKQKEILGLYHEDTIQSLFHMALAQDKLGKFDEALKNNKAIYKHWKQTFGPNHRDTVSSLNNVAMVLGNQGKYEESLKIYNEVLKKKKIILGINHSETLRTMQSIAGVLSQQKKLTEAMRVYREVLEIQKRVMPQDHPETLNTQYNIAMILLNEGKHISALKILLQTEEARIRVFGPNDPTVLTIKAEMENMRLWCKLRGTKMSVLLEDLQTDMNVAATNGDKQTVKRLLEEGADANETDAVGRTPMHFAVGHNRKVIVRLLLQYEADVTIATNKGNTPLHTAVSKGYKDIVEVLLQTVSRCKIIHFVDAKTTATGTTATHIAVQNGFAEVVNILLKHGASYNILNKEGKAPIDLSTSQDSTNLLTLIDELFQGTKTGNIDIESKLNGLTTDNLNAIANCRNREGETLLGVAMSVKNVCIAGKLRKILKEGPSI